MAWQFNIITMLNNYLAFFAFAVKGILKKKGINYEETMADSLETSPEGGLEVK